MTTKTREVQLTPEQAQSLMLIQERIAKANDSLARELETQRLMFVMLGVAESDVISLNRQTLSLTVKDNSPESTLRLEKTVNEDP